MKKALKSSSAVLLVSAATVGCGHGGGAARASPTDPGCYPATDVRSFRGNVAAQVDASVLPAADRDAGLMAGADGRSFVARARVSELAAARIDNLGQVPDGRELLLFVNHGAWNQDEVFAYSRGLGNGADPPPELRYPTITWVVNVVDSRTHRVLERVTSPRADGSVCFLG